MKKLTLSLALLAGAFTFTSCGSGSSSSLLSSVGQGLLSNALGGTTTSSSSSSTSTTSSTTSVISSLLSSLISGSSTISTSDLTGTWNYTGTDCVFESENLLAQAGGAVAATKLESQLNTQLSKVGIKEGSCSFTFNSDNTYTATIGGRTISGNYTLDSSNNKIKLTYLAGLGSTTPRITKSGSKISLLFESDKLLTLLKGASALSNNSTLSTVSSLLGNYDGLYLGLEMSK